MGLFNTSMFSNFSAEAFDFNPQNLCWNTSLDSDVESKVRSQPNYQFADRGVTLEINVFMLDVAPEAFDKDIIKGTTFADWEIAQGGTAIAAD